MLASTFKPAAMGHAQDNFLDALFGRLFDGQIQQRNQALAAFQGKALGPDEFFADEFLERDRVGQAGEDADLLLARQFQPVARAFHPFCSQRRISKLSMCMNCTPMERQ